MNKAAFLVDAKKCKNVLDDYGILRKVNHMNIREGSYIKFSEEFRKAAQKQNYNAAYIKGMESDDYDYLLKDGSFFQFSYDLFEKDFTIRLAFYPSINDISYDDFLAEQIGSGIEECGAAFLDDYQQFITEQESKSVSPIRYDYNSKIYKKFIHSASHLHFGNEEDIRVPLNKILLPSAFTKIVLQYFYYELWKNKVVEQDYKSVFIQNNESHSIDQKYFLNDEKIIPYIHIGL